MKKHTGALIFAALISSFVFVCMTKYCFSSAMVFIVDEGYMTNFQTGLINSAFWLVYAIGQLFGGVIADRWHPERLILIGLLSGGVSSGLIFFFHENYALTLIIWTVNAFLQFGVYPALFKITSAIFSGRMLTVALVIVTLATPMATMLSYVVVALVPRWQMSFVISSLLLFLFSAVWCIVMTVPGRYTKDLHMTGGGAKREAAEAKPGAPGISMTRLVLSSGLSFVFIISLLRCLIAYMPSMMPSVIKSAYDSLTPTTSTFVSLVPLFCSVIGPLCSSLLATRVKNEIVVSAAIFALILPAGLVTLLLGTVSYWLIITAMAIVTLGVSTVAFFIGSLVSVNFNKWEKGATVAGIINGAGALGNVIGSALMSWIADHYSWHSALVAVVICIAAVLAVALIEIPIWTRFKKTHHHEGG